MHLRRLIAPFVAAACTALDLHAQNTVQYQHLSNGLRVVLSVDSSAPIARMGVYYRVGSVNETQGRAGFAHLFEHFMFEGSPNVAPGEYFELVVSNGGRFGAR